MKSRLLLTLVWLMCFGVGRLLAAESALSGPPGTAAAVAPAEIKKPEVRNELTAEIKRQFPFIAKPAEEKVTESAAPAKSEPLVMMAPYRVNEGYRGVASLLEEQRKKQEAEKFTWKRGGTLYKAGQVELKFFDNPEHQTFGKVPPGGKAFIDLLNIKF